MAKEYLGEQTLAKLIGMISAQFKKYPAPDQVADKQYVDEEIATFDFIKIVPELPETGLVNRTYFVPKTSSETNDLYDEYMWINDDWEYRGSKQIEVDLTEYVKKTDYAHHSKAGLVKTDGTEAYKGVDIVNGVPCLVGAASPLSDAYFNNPELYRVALLSKDIYRWMKVGLTTNTNELTEDEQAAARAWLGAIGATDYASDSKCGVVKVSNYRGMKVLSGGIITLMAPTDTQIDTRNNGGDVAATTAVTLSKFDHTLKTGLTTNAETLTDEEKSAALAWLGALPKVTTAGTYYDRVYAVDMQGKTQKMLDVSNSFVANTIAQRTESGALFVNTPTADNHATTKAYVDGLVGDVESALDGIIAIQNSLIGGDS